MRRAKAIFPVKTMSGMKVSNKKAIQNSMLASVTYNATIYNTDKQTEAQLAKGARQKSK